jgi:hypothetical protein
MPGGPASLRLLHATGNAALRHHSTHLIQPRLGAIPEDRIADMAAVLVGLYLAFRREN